MPYADHAAYSAYQRRYQRQRKRAERDAAAPRPRPERCECCGNRNRSGRLLSWDHDHGTGRFRGWLCSPCNSVLGFVGDNPRILEALKAYLAEHGGTVSRTKIS